MEHSTAIADWERRASMLQGDEPVTTAYKLPDEFDFDRFNDVVWLEAVASNPHMHSPTTSTIAMVALELNRKLADGNSPVIPDGWVILPAEPTQAMMNAWLSEVANWHGHAAGYRAMIAAAPQQEAKNV
ncbi:TPA: eaa protein [Enterobacter hormaechei subsp. xiangfangensis]|nr:eaa protein [Enterobacter hormaechei subsp. xiangfangensis]MXS02895.1 eaa protein [Enterobacter hormaechei]HCJ0094209.1 eaa protein [Enterobacter hormaechei subsp. xiangfangensis]